MFLVRSMAFLALFVSPALADDGCTSFAWSLKLERQWFAAPGRAAVREGATLSQFPTGAVHVALSRAREAHFAQPPERKPRAESWFGGALHLPAVPRAGLYQVTLSEEAWLDAIQNGRYVRSVGSTGRRDCPGLRKSVRFNLVESPLVLQLSGVTADTITIAVTPAE